eukprot:c46578_g1_i1 orf=2-154(-)
MFYISSMRWSCHQWYILEVDILSPSSLTSYRPWLATLNSTDFHIKNIHYLI